MANKLSLFIVLLLIAICAVMSTVSASVQELSPDEIYMPQPDAAQNNVNRLPIKFPGNRPGPIIRPPRFNTIGVEQDNEFSMRGRYENDGRWNVDGSLRKGNHAVDGSYDNKDGFGARYRYSEPNREIYAGYKQKEGIEGGYRWRSDKGDKSLQVDCNFLPRRHREAGVSYDPRTGEKRGQISGTIRFDDESLAAVDELFALFENEFDLRYKRDEKGNWGVDGRYKNDKGHQAAGHYDSEKNWQGQYRYDSNNGKWSGDATVGGNGKSGKWSGEAGIAHKWEDESFGDVVMG